MNAPPRALIVDLSTRFGGTSARVLGLLNAMPRGQTAPASLEGSPVTTQARDSRLEVHCVGRNKFDPRIARRITSVVRAERFQVIDVQNPQSKLWGSRAAARSGAALVSTLNSWYLSEHGGNLKGRMYQKLEWWTSRRQDLFIAVSPEIEHKLLESGVAQDRIAHIPNAISIEPASITGGTGWLCKAYGLPPDSQVVCAIGRLVPAKGFEYLVSSMQQLASRFSRLRCLIVGDGELRQELSAQIERAKLRDVVHLVGYKERHEVLKLVKACDLFAMPSITEGTPVALLEAAALAKPIVATNAGGIPSMLTHDESALLVTPADTNELTDSLAAMLTDPERAGELGHQARKRVEDDFSMSVQLASTLDAYSRAVTLAAARS